jgi:hypothetical protein
LYQVAGTHVDLRASNYNDGLLNRMVGKKALDFRRFDFLYSSWGEAEVFEAEESKRR